jgi:UDP-glucose 4-epimerase
MIKDGLRGRDVLVTGGAGFIGSHLVDRLVELGARVTVLDNLSFGRRENVNPAANLLEHDVTDYSQVKKDVGRKELVIHLAASATTKESSMGWKDPLYDYRVNALGTLHLLRAVAELADRPRIVYASTAAVYGIPERVPVDESHDTRPISPYGVSKLAGEKYCYAYWHEHALDVVAVRIFNTYGPRQTRYVMFDLLTKLRACPERLEVLGDGEQVRDYCYVSDTVDGLLIAAQRGAAGSVLNLASGQPVVIRELVGRVLKTADLDGTTEVCYTGHTWRGDIPKLLGDSTKLRRLGFKPRVSLEEGLRRLNEWVRGVSEPTGARRR